jgi:prefoldin alpha subunit
LEKRALANKGEEELRQLAVEQRLLEQTADAVQSRINMVNAVVTDLTYASAALDALEKEKENSELLVPIGGGSYVKAKLGTPDKVIVSVGAGVSIEKTVQEAKETVKKRLEDLGKTRLSLQQQFAQVVGKLDENRQKLDQLVGSMRQEKTSTDV